MPLTSRELVREEISDLFDSITALQANLAYPPLALEGKSPLLYIHNSGTLPEMLGAYSNQFDYFFTLTICINRKAHGESASETLLDQIWTNVLQKIRDNNSGTNYSVLSVWQEKSSSFFATVDGIPYRFEDILVMARSNISG